MVDEVMDRLREAIKEEEARGAFEEPEQAIEFDAHIINPSDYVVGVAPTATREMMLANLETKDRKPTVRQVSGLFEVGHFINVLGKFLDIGDLDGKAFQERGYRLLNLSRSVGMAQQKELRTRRVEVAGGEKKKGWRWR